MRDNDDYLFLSKFEVDPEYDIFLDSMEDPESCCGDSEDLLFDDSHFDEFADDIWEV